MIKWISPRTRPPADKQHTLIVLNEHRDISYTATYFKNQKFRYGTTRSEFMTDAGCFYVISEIYRWAEINLPGDG